jgi:hypothetical protein
MPGKYGRHRPKYTRLSLCPVQGGVQVLLDRKVVLESGETEHEALSNTLTEMRLIKADIKERVKAIVKEKEEGSM